MEQTQGKAVIDILVYRQAKILASALLIVFSAFSVSLIAVQWLTIVCLFAWIFVALKLWGKTKKYDKHTINIQSHICVIYCSYFCHMFVIFLSYIERADI